MEPDQIIERLGSDNPPTIAELNDTKTALAAATETLAGQIREAKGGPLADLVALKADYDAVVAADAKVTAALADAQAAVDAIIAEVEPAAEVVEPEPEIVEETPDEPVAVAASIRSTLARVRTPKVEVVSEPSDLTHTSTSLNLLGKDVETLSSGEIGQAFADAHRRFSGSKTSVLSIKTDLHPDRQLTGDASANERKMLDLFGTNPFVPVTASGGCCSIPEPIYDQPLIGDLSRPIKASFDALQASRGAVQAYPPVCIPDEGADVWTCIQDAAVDPDDPDTWKSCTVFDCETSEPTLVEPIFKCLTTGEFQRRFAPEQWEAILFQTDKLAARLAEARLFGWLQDATTHNFTGLTTGSTYANFINSQVRAAALARQEQRLGDAQMVTYGPDWIYAAILEDSLTRRLNDVETVEIVKAKVDAALAEEGIRYIGSQDVADLDTADYSGAMPSYPNAPLVMLPAGAAKFLDGGEKNLGLIENDLALARQNTVGSFSEFWEGLLVRNCRVTGIDLTVELCGTIGCIGA